MTIPTSPDRTGIPARRLGSLTLVAMTAAVLAVLVAGLLLWPAGDPPPTPDRAADYLRQPTSPALEASIPTTTPAAPSPSAQQPDEEAQPPFPHPIDPTTLSFSFRVARFPAELHDPLYAEQFEEAARALPVLGAVRVRSERRYATRRLEAEAGEAVAFLLDPQQVARSFETGRLLFATDAELASILAAVRRGEPPEALPAVPDVSGLFADKRGPYSCDAVLSDEANGPAVIRAQLPAARLSGEPVAREAERRDAIDLIRAMILGLVAACGWGFYRRHTRGDAERRLFAVLLPLAVLCSIGWGIEGWSVLALVLAGAAPRGPVLLSGALCLFFPSMVLKRMGVVFLCAGIVRWSAPPGGVTRPGPVRVAILAGGLVLALLLVLAAPRQPTRLPAPLRGSPAATFVDPAALDTEVAALQSRGIRVLGDADPLPPPATGARARTIARIYYAAEVLAKQDERFVPVRRAAATDSMDWPAGLRAWLMTRDRRRVLWAQQPGLEKEPRFMSAELYRLRGAAALRRDGRIAALLLLAVTGVAMLVTQATRAALLLTLGGILAGALLLVLAERGAMPVNAEAALPLVVMAGHCGSGVAVVGLLAAAAGHSVLLWPALGLSLAAACAWLSRPRLR